MKLGGFFLEDGFPILLVENVFSSDKMKMRN